jgi:hypothetical protein
LVKKCKELLSQSLQGRLIRYEILRDVMPLLWHGLTSESIRITKANLAAKVRNDEKLAKLIAYFNRTNEMSPLKHCERILGCAIQTLLAKK